MTPKSTHHDVPLTRVYAWFSALISEDSTLIADLFAHGFPIDTPHPLRHTTALMEATRLGRTGIVLWLLEHGAAPAFSCGLPLGTPLHCAIRRQHWAIAQTLLDAMPSAAVRDAYGRTPLHLLCMDEVDPLHIPQMLMLAKNLLAKGCPIETLDHEGTTALHHCAINDAPELAELLLDHGANANCMIPDTKVNPLIIAALEQNMNIASLLLHHGADPYQATRDGVTAISIMPTILRLLGHRALGRMPLHEWMRAHKQHTHALENVAHTRRIRYTARLMTYTHKMSPLPAAYDTAATEKKWQEFWLNNKTYAWNPDVVREDSYVIDTPPPTVSGTLHMGHVFSYTQADFIARFQRMNGKNVFYPMGFDDNGLPTERLVEKTKKSVRWICRAKPSSPNVLSVSEEARAEFRALFRSIALSVDWDQEYHTISDSSRRLSQLSFLDLVEKQEVYRSLRPFYWDPVDQTAIASAEIEDKELPSFANDIVFKVVPNAATNSAVTPAKAGAHVETTPVRDDVGATPNRGLSHMDSRLRGNDAAASENLIIMTTRPELLPACVALFCHPGDSRYQHLIGKTATVPLFGFSVPILTDDTVDPEKGTGLMMCCTFGDDADIVKWQKHQLPSACRHQQIRED